MARTRWRNEPPNPSFDANGATPGEIRAEFANRLQARLIELHWSQSELARRADDSRDNISNYVRQRALPEPQRLAKLATTLDVEPDWLVPRGTPSNNRDVEAFDAKQLSSNRVRLRINQVVSWDTFVKIAAALKEDENMGNADKS